MGAFFMNEGVFDLPEVDFNDKTVHLLSTKIGPDKEIGLVVCRNRIKGDRSLEDLVHAHLEHEARSLRGFAVLGRSDAECAGLPAVDVSSRYRLKEEMAYQRQVHVVFEATWMMFGATSPLADRGLCDELLTGVVSSFRLRNG